RRPAPTRLPDAGLGGFRSPGRDGNPSLWRREHSDREALACHARKPDSDNARGAHHAPASRIDLAGSIRRTILLGTGRPSAGRGQRLSGSRREARKESKAVENELLRVDCLSAGRAVLTIRCGRFCTRASLSPAVQLLDIRRVTLWPSSRCAWYHV